MDQPVGQGGFPVVDVGDDGEVADLGELDHGQALAIAPAAGGSQGDERPWLLAHLSNHQTHHRDQAHDMLMRTQVKPPVLDP
ncbi:MAG: hypothetical protein IIC53_06890 [Proteobacteria bacterium]|nr:hypothetical protein [Pseudomonadota bacterium]